MNKDKITNICGIVAAVAGGVLTAEKAGVQMPQSITIVCTLLVGVSLGIIGYFTGKPNTPVS